MTQLANQNSNTPAATGVKALSSFLNSDSIKKKFGDVLGQKANGFIASLLSVVSNDKGLVNADQSSIYSAALLAASLDLPINPNLGLAYLIAYRQKDGSQVATFQLGYRGFKQLAQRSGQFLKISESDVREGEIKSFSRMTGEINFKEIQDQNKRLQTRIVGYVSYFKLINGFESYLYMTVEELEAHAKKYSQTYKKFGTGLWKDEFDGMCRKTVTKLNLSKNAPLSIELQRAVVADQAVIKSFEPAQGGSVVVENEEETIDVTHEYVDNPRQEPADRDQLSEMIAGAATLDDLITLEKHISDDDVELLDAYKAKKIELGKAAKKDLKEGQQNRPGML